LAVALVGWGVRHAPRTGTVLTGLTVLSSVWWYTELRVDGGAIVGPSSRAPLGPLEDALPLFGTDSPGVTVALAAAAAALLALLVREGLAWRARADAHA